MRVAIGANILPVMMRESYNEGMRAALVVLLLSSTMAAQQSPSLTFRGQQRPKHAQVAATPADVAVKAGTKAMLFVDVTPNPSIHVYAPGTRDFIPITVKFDPQAGVRLGKLTYPKSETMTFADEKVPVFQKPFRLTQEIALQDDLKAGTSVPVKATVDFQACDDKVCYPPESAQVSWTLTVK
jgi:DsbC/DsbD-like thiol-disulfide interchange protein